MADRNKRTLGASYEEAAAVYLKRYGMEIRAKNFRCRQGEIDLVGVEGDEWVFVEVKYRRDEGNGFPAEAVDARKQARICRVADYYLYRYGLSGRTPVRFDVVAVCGKRIDWYRNAFEYRESR